MSTLDPRLSEELDRLAPLTTVSGDWDAVVKRARGRQRRRRLSLALSTGAVLLMLVLTPLGGAVARGIGGFSDWLSGTPGPPAAPSAQSAFDKANRFPDHPRLHELLRTTVGDRRFFLYGFQTRQVVCLRVTVHALPGGGPQAACASRADLRRSGDLVLPVKANLRLGGLGPPGSSTGKGAPSYTLTFGLVASQVRRLTVETDTGATAVVVRNGAFLHVLEDRRQDAWARAVKATTRSGRSEVVPLSIEARHQPTLRTGLKLHGPATLDRSVKGGTIGWFLSREPRGIPARAAGLAAYGHCCTGFARVIYPDPNDFLAIAIGDKTLFPHLGAFAKRVRAATHLPPVPQGKNAVCYGELTRAGMGGTCSTMRRLFHKSPLALGWGFSGAGQQLWLVSGLASDAVARIEVFQGDGRHWAAPLRDNTTAFRIQRAKFPARIVAYDHSGNVIAIQTLRGG